MKWYSVLLLLILPFLFKGCKFTGTIEKADDAYKLQQYAVAAGMYEKLFRQQPTMAAKAKVAYKTAESYRKMNKWEESAEWYEKARQLNYPDPELFYRYGQVLKQQGKFDLALEVFQKFKREAPGDPRATQAIESVSLYHRWKNDKARFVIQKDAALNSINNDYSPVYFLDENVIYFTSDRQGSTGEAEYGRTGLPFCDMYRAEWNVRENDWKTPQKVEGEINSNFNEGVVNFQKFHAQYFIYYTQCNGPKGEERNCKILRAQKKGMQWINPQPLSFCTDTNVNYGHPTITKDGKTMYFASNMKGGKGGKDIYVSHFNSKSGTWGEPENTGSPVNTSGDEKFPFIYNGKTLYFASDGHGGLGGLDIYESTRKNNSWTEPENLKPPVNSSADDFSLIFNEKGNKGHFTSNRENGKDNIYAFYLKPKICVIRGTVVNSKIDKPVKNAEVTVNSDKKGAQPQSLKTGKNGEFIFDDYVECDYNYEVQANKEKFFASQMELISTSNVEVSDTFYRKLYIEPYPLTEIRIEGIYYGLDSFNLRKESLPVLDSLVNIMEYNPEIVVELASHTDCRATKGYNDTLSQRRAQSVVKYLVDHGINPKRLVPKGYGERKLVNNCACENGEGPGLDCTEKEHQLNRRTTFKILRTNFKQEDK